MLIKPEPFLRQRELVFGFKENFDIRECRICKEFVDDIRPLTKSINQTHSPPTLYVSFASVSRKVLISLYDTIPNSISIKFHDTFVHCLISRRQHPPQPPKSFTRDYPIEDLSRSLLLFINYSPLFVPSWPHMARPTFLDTIENSFRPSHDTDLSSHSSSFTICPSLPSGSRSWNPEFPVPNV